MGLCGFLILLHFTEVFGIRYALISRCIFFLVLLYKFYSKARYALPFTFTILTCVTCMWRKWRVWVLINVKSCYIQYTYAATVSYLLSTQLYYICYTNLLSYYMLWNTSKIILIFIWIWYFRYYMDIARLLAFFISSVSIYYKFPATRVLMVTKWRLFKRKKE